MTINQWKNLKEGDLVTRTGGPNKGVAMKVTRKWLAYEPNGEVLSNMCLAAEGIEPDTVYNQRNRYRKDNWTSGAASTFKLLKEPVKREERKWAVVDICDNALYFVDHKPTYKEILNTMGIRAVKAK